MSDDPNKLSSTVVDLTTTITQPLLSKPYPVITTYHGGATITQPENEEEDPTQFLKISYNYGPRPCKNISFLILFIIFILSTFGFGIYASINTNPYHDQASIFTFNPSTSTCTLPTSSNSSKANLFNNYIWTFQDITFLKTPTSLNSSESNLIDSLIWTLVITLLLSIPFALFVLIVLKNYTKQIVYISIPFFVLVPLFLNVYWFVVCTLKSTCSEAFPLPYRILVFVFVFLLIGLIVWIFVVNWHRIELTVKIIKVSSNALSQNLRLFVILPVLTIGLFVYYAMIIMFLVFANLNGEIVPKGQDGHFHCVWRQYSWVPAYYTFAILTMLWSAASMMETQVYIISDTIAQWYFSKEHKSPKHGIRNSLRNAFGTSSGTICLSGILICVVRIVRAMVDSAREENASGIINFVLRCCVNSLLTTIEFLNKFTINFVAITGESYCTSARMTYELLKRNLLSAVFVETVSTRVLSGIILVFSSLYAILVCVILKAVIHLGVDAYFVSVMAWLLLMVVLGFFVHVLENVIDTVYVCYAIDRDNGEVFKHEVHEVYVHLPLSRSHRSGFGVRTPPPIL